MAAPLQDAAAALRSGPLAGLPQLPAARGAAAAAPSTLYNVNPDGSCGVEGQFLTVLVTGTSGSLANAQCSLGFEGFPDPIPEEDCDGLIFGKECAVLRASLVVSVGGFGRTTDSPDVGAVLRLLGLSKLESVGGLFFDVADGARVKALDALPSLKSVGGDGVQLLGGRQVAAAPSLAGVGAVTGSLFLVSTALPTMAPLSAVTQVGGAALLVNNFNLTSLSGLASLARVGGGLVLAANHRLRDLDGLVGLTAVGDGGAGAGGGGRGVSVANNTRLVSLAGLASLAAVGGKLHIANNPTLASLDGLQGVRSVNGLKVGGGGGATPAPARLAAGDAGAAHADVSIVGNRVLSNVSALAALGGCGGAPGAGASVQVEVFPSTGVLADPAAAAAADARPSGPAMAAAISASAPPAGGGFSTAALVPPLANDVDAPRQAALRDASLAAATIAGRPVPPGFLVAAPDAARGVPVVRAAAPRADAGGFTAAAAEAVLADDVDGAAEDAADAAAAERADEVQAAWAAANEVADAAVAGDAEAAQALAAVTQPPSRRRLNAPSIADDDPSIDDSPKNGGGPAGDASRRAGPLARLVAGTPLGAVLPTPPEPPLGRLASGAAAGGGGPPLRPPWARAAAPAPADAAASPDPRLALALALKPDTRCMFVSWEAVCAYISNPAIPADHSWRADGTCAPYVPPPLGAAASGGPPLRLGGR